MIFHYCYFLLLQQNLVFHRKQIVLTLVMLNVLSVCSASVKKMQTLPSLFSCCQTSLSRGDLPNGWSCMLHLDHLMKIKSWNSCDSKTGNTWLVIPFFSPLGTSKDFYSREAYRLWTYFLATTVLLPRMACLVSMPVNGFLDISTHMLVFYILI